MTPSTYTYKSHTRMPSRVTSSGFSTVYDIINACYDIDVNTITERSQVDKALMKVCQMECICLMDVGSVQYIIG